MKSFECTCGQPLFFPNSLCLSCKREVAYDPDIAMLGPVVDAGDGTLTIDGDPRMPAPRFRYCEHRTLAAKCNWLIRATSDATACASCRLTRMIPDLSRPKNLQRLAELETAKRRVLAGVMAFGLPIVPRSEDPVCGLAFDFLEQFPEEPPVMTGHAAGLITLNVAEADADYREKHRESLHEPYRTLIGHLRHELGHFYWDRLIDGTDWLPKFRELFGDERASYSEALEHHYQTGGPADWPDRFISAYASSHPWEDWAECFAHYMHLRATLLTVVAYDLDISHVRLPLTPYTADVLYEQEPADEGAWFLGWINAWLVLTAVLNETARNMGQPDLYPFVLNRAVVTKLHFMQCVFRDGGRRPISAPPATLAVLS